VLLMWVKGRTAHRTKEIVVLSCSVEDERVFVSLLIFFDSITTIHSIEQWPMKMVMKEIDY
jgi:hypothetical protein